MISVIIVAGLAGLWLWTVLNDDEGIAAPLHHLLLKHPITKKWMSCPWCSGAWFSIVASVILYHPSVLASIVVALAASAVCGLVGSYVAGE